MDLAIGQIIGDYEVLAVLGAGGMGKVYKVRSTISHRIEAMKILLPDLNAAPELAERFLREIQIAASLDHPNIAGLRSAQRVDNQLLMIMEFIDGSTLSSLMTQARLPLERCLRVVSQALSALDYAHSRNVIHRDIKPENIMITSAGEVKLMDFGIAKLATESSLTRTGMMLGSVPYMSPEHIEGREVDARSDIYSIGVTLYELVTGKRPFSGKSDYEIMTAHLTTSPQPPRELDPSLPAVVNEVILTAMAKNPADRFATAKAMQNAVNSTLSSLAQPAATTKASVPVMATTVGMNPAPAAASASASPSNAKARGNHRMLYMTAGSLATVAVLIAGAFELPRLFHTKANDGAVVRQQPAPEAAKPLPSGSVPAAAPNTGDTQATPPQTDTKPQVSEKQTATEPARKSVVDPPPAAKASRVRSQAEPPTASELRHAPVPAASAPAETNPGAPPAPAPSNQNSTQIAELRDRMMLMSARVSSVRGSLDNLKSAQAQSGLGLRRDMADAEQRLLYQMGEAGASLNANDAAAAAKRLDAAENDLDKLESFLGK